MVRDAFPLPIIDEALQAGLSTVVIGFLPGTVVPPTSDGGKQHKKDCI